MFADFQEAVWGAYSGVFTWGGAALTAGAILLAILIIGLGLYKRINR